MTIGSHDTRRVAWRHAAKAGVIALSLLCLPGAAQAASGLYVSLTGGGVFPDDTSSNVGTRLSYNPGYSVLAAAGLGILVMRLELEAGYRQADVMRATVGGTASSAGGNAGVVSGMVNGYVDLPFSIIGLRPYIGVGVGGAQVDLDHVTAAGAPLFNGRQTVFAFQGMAGLSFDLAPHLTLVGGYRFFGTDNVQVHSQLGGGAIATRANGLRTHSAELGLRLTF